MSEPKKIGRYEVQSLLGEGAMGSVFCATDPNIGRTVAIKIVKFVHSNSDDEDTVGFRERFQQEARISGNLNHPNIVAVYDVDEYEGMPFIAMEFVEGRTLTEYMRNEAHDGKEKVALLCRLASALDFAHSRGVVHRDLKPANIMVTQEDVPKIMDFGIAKTSGINLTQTGVFLGTPSYSSPEQVKEGHVDHRSDIFSFGILACELLTGRAPFKGKSINAILYKIANEPPVFVTDAEQLAMPLSHFREIFSKVLDKNPERRFQSATDFTRQLAAAVHLPKQEAATLSAPDLSATVAIEVGVSKKLARNEFETADAATMATALETKQKKSGKLWLAVLIMLPLLLGGLAYFLHSSGRLNPLLEQAGSLLGSPPPEPEPLPIVEPVTEPELLQAQLTIGSRPEGAEVRAGDTVLGNTPYQHEWKGPAGETLALTVSLAGYKPASLNLTLGGDLESEYTLDLAALPVERLVRASPAGATLEVDGKVLGKTPVSFSFAVGQTYRLRLSLKDYLPTSFSYTEGKTSANRLNMKLKPKPPPGTLEVVSLIEDLRLTVDGRAHSGNRLQLEPGTYRLQLQSKKYYYEEQRKITISSQETTRLETPVIIKIPKIDFIGGYVNVKIDGRFVKTGKGLDTTPMVNLSLTAGTHIFEFILPDGKIVQQKTIEVTRSEDIVVSADR